MLLFVFAKAMALKSAKDLSSEIADRQSETDIMIFVFAILSIWPVLIIPYVTILHTDEIVFKSVDY